MENICLKCKKLMIGVCDNDCGTIVCLRCDLEYHIIRTNTGKKLVAGHNKNCGKDISFNNNDEITIE